MLGWNDFDRTFAAMDELRRRVERALDEGAAFETTRWPQVSVWDAGKSLMLQADVPGLTAGDVQLQLTNDVLTVSGARKADAPAGYSVHRQERTPVRFSRSFTLPCKVDADAISASLEDGVLTVTLPKAAESQPRHIAVKAA